MPELVSNVIYVTFSDILGRPMQRIGFIVLPGFQMLSLGSLSVFELANWEIGEPVYDVHLLSETGGSIRSSVSISVATEPFDDRNFDTLMVGGSVVAGALTPGVIKFLRRGLRRSRRVASTCTGAFVLAEAGLLDGRRENTHWHRARELQARFPKVKVEEDRIFIVDGSVWTSAGMTAGIDLALAMIEKDLGADVARTVARTIGGLSSPRRRPVAVLCTAGAGAQIRPHPERAGLCEAQSHLEADG